MSGAVHNTKDPPAGQTPAVAGTGDQVRISGDGAAAHYTAGRATNAVPAATDLPARRSRPLPYPGVIRATRPPAPRVPDTQHAARCWEFCVIARR